MLKNIAFMGGLSFYRSAVQFGINIYVAALVTPHEYGLITFTAPFIGMIAMLTDLGLSSAIVRQSNLSKSEAGAAMTLVVAVGVAFALALALAARPIARASHIDDLPPVMMAMAVVVFLSVSATPARALLERELRYGRIAGIEASAVFAAAILSVTLAHLRWGVWALVAYNLAAQALRFVMFYAFARHSLQLNFGWRRLGAMLSFGGWVLGFNILNFASNNVDNILVGAVLGASSVGLYGLGYQFMTIPLIAITWPTSGVLLATLSRRAGDVAAIRATVAPLLATTALLSFPAMMMLTFALTYPVHVFMSSRWWPVVNIIALLAPVGAIQSLASYDGAILMAQGYQRLQFTSGMIRNLALIATFVCALPFGLGVFVAAFAITASACALGEIALILWKTEMSPREFWHLLIPAVSGTGAGMLVVTLFSLWWSTGSLASWLFSIAIYGAAVGAVYMMFRERVRADVRELIAVRNR